MISIDCKRTEEFLRSKSPSKEFRDERKLAAYLSAFGRPDSPDEPAGFALLDGVPLLTLLKQLSGLPRDGKVSVLNVDVDFVLGETRQFERRSYLVLIGVFVWSILPRKSQFDPRLQHDEVRISFGCIMREV